MRINRKYYIIGILLCVVPVSYYLDKGLFMRDRVLRHSLWVYESGDRSFGSTMYTEGIIFKGDTMIFNYNNKANNTLILKYQYFGTMKVLNPKTGKTIIYEMKGSNWIDYWLK